MSKKEKALDEILQKGYITSWTAFKKHKNTRLSASIFNLRNEGWNIKMKMFANPKTKSCYGVYYLNDKEIKKYEQNYLDGKID